MLKEQTIVLSTPIKLNELEVKELNLREPQVSHMKQVQNLSGYEQTTKLISLITGHPPLMIEQMALTDYQKCVGFFDSLFLPSDPAA
jgi:hypothetical protein